nr:TPA_asm: hypothetical protein HUJ06_005502 [Nelumbo nucifera]
MYHCHHNSSRFKVAPFLGISSLFFCSLSIELKPPTDRTRAYHRLRLLMIYVVFTEPFKRSISQIALTSTCNTTLPRTLSNEDNNTNPRDASFSSYLRSAKQTFIQELTESARNPAAAFTDSQEPLHQVAFGRKKTEDSEIGVFSAEKYFNGGMDEEKPRIVDRSPREHLPRKDERHNPVDVSAMRSKLKLGTPSSCSEASWNSRSALLPSRLRDLSPSRTNKIPGKRFFVGLGCNCACSDKKSVEIDEDLGGNKNNSRNSKNHPHFEGLHSRGILTKQPIKIDRDPFDLVGIKQTRFKEDMACDKVGSGLTGEQCFSFPVFNPGVGNLTVKRQFEEEKEKKEKPRKSLEVFGSPIMEKGGDVNLNLGRRLPMLTWDAIPRAQETTANSGSRGLYDDMESDASSDLFEIENLSSNANPYLIRQASDTMSSCVTPTTCYEPSEASVDRGVVTATAGAANFSVALVPAPPTLTNPDGMIPTSTKPKTLMAKEEQRRGGHGHGMLFGCRSQKAVDVAGDALRMSERASFETRRRHRSESFTSISRFQAEAAKVMDLESAHAQRAFGTLTRSLSARASDSSDVS